MRRILSIALLLGFALASYADEVPKTFVDWVEPDWVNPIEDVVVEVRVVGLSDISIVNVTYSYPNGASGEVVAKSSVIDASLYSFVIPDEIDAGLGELKYLVDVTRVAGRASSGLRTLPMGYEDDLEITANPPEILWFPLGDKSAVVRYKACCNILGASIIAKRTPVNPMESSKGLPDKLYSDFVWLEPDALAASTAGLYFEFGFTPRDFVLYEKRYPTVYEYDWKDEVWEPVLTFEIVDGKVVDFPATEGGVYVLGRE